MFAHQLGMLQINRARVRLFFCDADFRQELDQDLSLDLQLPRQFIDADLIGICHSPLCSLDFPNTRCDYYYNRHFSDSKRELSQLRLLRAFFGLTDCFFPYCFAGLVRGLVESFRLGFGIGWAYGSVLLRSRRFVRGDLLGGLLSRFVD